MKEISENPYQPPAPAGQAAAERSLPQTSVWLVLLLSLVTLRVYVLYWYWSRRKALDRLAPEGGFGSGLLLAATILFAGALMLGFASGAMSGTAAENVYFVAQLFEIGAAISIIVLSFRVKAVLESSYPIDVSGVATFFLTILYLQYKINRLDEASSSYTPGGGLNLR